MGFAKALSSGVPRRGMNNKVVDSGIPILLTKDPDSFNITIFHRIF